MSESRRLDVDDVLDLAWGQHPDDRAGKSDGEIWKHWTSLWNRRIDEDWDNVIVIDGERGAGKSTLALLIAQELDKTFTEDRVALSAAEMLEFWGKLPRRSAVVYDEAVFGLLSRQFASKENVALVQAVMAARKLGITVILCIPDMMILDSAFRESAVKFRIFVQERGVAVVHVRSERIRYDQSQPRRFYSDPHWNPLRWDPLPNRGLWGRYRARTELAVREWSVRAAAGLSAPGQFSSSAGKEGSRPQRRPKRINRQTRVRCERCGLRVARWNLAVHRKSARCQSRWGHSAVESDQRAGR